MSFYDDYKRIGLHGTHPYLIRIIDGYASGYVTGNTIGVCIFMAVYSEIVTIVLIHTVVRGEP